MSHPYLRDGWLVSDSWFGDHEGPFTRLAKIALVNKLSASDINKALYGIQNSSNQFGLVHGRSLMDATWMCSSQVAARKDVSSPLQLAALSNFCGGACCNIASDQRARFCRICLSVGFQSSFFQIDGIQRCPLHGELLFDRCEHCGKPTPRYAIEASSFENPMHCAHCGSSFSDAWTQKGMVDFWSPSVNRRILQNIASWLRAIKDLCVPEANSLTVVGLWDVDYRRTAFDFLRRLVPLKLPWLESPAITVIVGPTPSPVTREEKKEENRNERKKIYRAIRRHYRRMLKIPRLIKAEFANDDMECEFNYTVYSLHGIAPALHGFILWQARFERQFLPRLYLETPSKSAFRTRLEFSPAHDAPEDNFTWGHFVHFCLLQDLQQAHIWADKMRCLEYLNNEARRIVRREHLLDDASDMYPWKGRLPWGVGLVNLHDRVAVFRLRDPYPMRKAAHLDGD